LCGVLLQSLALPDFPATSLSLHEFLFALLECGAPDDAALKASLDVLSRLGMQSPLDLVALLESEVMDLPLCEGHKLALIAVKRKGFHS
jgi:hypothetical protein